MCVLCSIVYSFVQKGITVFRRWLSAAMRRADHLLWLMTWQRYSFLFYVVEHRCGVCSSSFCALQTMIGVENSFLLYIYGGSCLFLYLFLLFFFVGCFVLSIGWRGCRAVQDDDEQEIQAIVWQDAAWHSEETVRCSCVRYFIRCVYILSVVWSSRSFCCCITLQRRSDDRLKVATRNRKRPGKVERPF